MHPMERLRMVARSSGEDPGMLAREAAAALAGCADDPRALVMACRRLVDRQPTSGPLWWLAARVVASADPETEAWRAAEALRADHTPALVAASLPDDATITVLGWPEQVTDALRRRGDARVLVVDSLGDGSPLVATLARAGSEAALVPEAGIGAAVTASSLVLLDASAVGPGGFLAVSGSHAAAAVAYTEQVPVWVVAGVGRVLPERLWATMAAAATTVGDPWEAEWEVVPLALATSVIGPDGPEPPGDALSRADCPDAPELTGGAAG
ncbi:MAG TPA: hypothetical protein VHF27_13440 [Acidimicrobiales bacterium]|nr:hypothetical protein [Acidimicrobiales bacterium]